MVSKLSSNVQRQQSGVGGFVGICVFSQQHCDAFLVAIFTRLMQSCDPITRLHVHMCTYTKEWFLYNLQMFFRNMKKLEWALGRAHTFAYHKIGH